MAPPGASGFRRRVLPRLLLYGSAVFLGLPLAFSSVLLRPVRQAAGPAPAGFEPLPLRVDGLALRALVRPGGGSRAAVLVVHGLGDSLDSFVGKALHLGQRGHTVALLDLRGHGGSEGDTCTLGALEQRDVAAALDALRQRGLAPRGTILMGHSMGASAAVLAAAGRGDVRAVVAEAPFDSYRETVAHHAWLLYRVPRWLPLVPVTVALAEWRGGFDADDADVVAAARRLRAPLLAIVDGADPRMPEAVVRRVVAAHPGPAELWVAPGAPHVGAELSPQYWPTVLGFLERHGL